MAETQPDAASGEQGADSRREVPAPARRRKRRYLLYVAALVAWIVGWLGGSRYWRPQPTAQQPAGPKYSFPELKPSPGLTADYRSRLEETYEVVCRLAESYPQSADAARAMALVQYFAHDTGAEVTCWERCLEIDPAYREAYDRLGTLASENGQYERVITLMRKALGAHPDYPAFHNMLAHALLSSGKVEEAIDVLEAHLEVHPDSVASHFLLGQGYLRGQANEEAKRHFERAVQLDPGHTAAYQGLATAYTRLGREEEAGKCREKLKGLKPGAEKTRANEDLTTYHDEVFIPRLTAEILTLAGYVHLDHGEPEQAEEVLLRAAALCPNDTECRKALCTLYDEQGRLSEAIRLTRELLELEPFDVTHHRNLGILCTRADRFDEAEETFRSLCGLAPGRALGYAGLAELYLQAQRKLPEAKRLALTAVQLEPTPRNHYLLAVACKSTGDQAGARSALLQRSVIQALEQAEARGRANARDQQRLRLLPEKR